MLCWYLRPAAIVFMIITIRYTKRTLCFWFELWLKPKIQFVFWTLITRLQSDQWEWSEDDTLTRTAFFLYGFHVFSCILVTRYTSSSYFSCWIFEKTMCVVHSRFEPIPIENNHLFSVSLMFFFWCCCFDDFSSVLFFFFQFTSSELLINKSLSESIQFHRKVFQFFCLVLTSILFNSLLRIEWDS